MLTIEKLKEFGANTEDGVGRCMENESFYIMLVSSILNDKKLDELEQSINADDLDKAFEAAHALKGMLSNLSLDPITKPINEMTELLRKRVSTDYTDIINEAKNQMEKLKSLA